MGSLIVNFLILALGAYLLVRSATLLVNSITIISRYFKLSEFTTAFILMGIITSIPEIAVSISSAIAGKPELAFGTAIGSNLTDLTLIVSLSVLLAGGITVRSIIAREDVLHMALYAGLPIIMILDGEISRVDGVILLIFYLLYLYRLISQQTHFVDHTNHVDRPTAKKQAVTFALATLTLFASSQLIVYSSSQIADTISIPLVLVGLVVVSIGTSLPELTYELRSVSLHHNQQVIGDILGSVVANSTVVIALAAIITPIEIHHLSEVLLSIILLVFVVFLFIIDIFNDQKLNIKEALVLLGIYLFFLISEFGLEIIHKAAW